MNLRRILTLLFILAIGFPSMAESPVAVLDKIKNKLSSASTVSADYTMITGGKTLTGKLKSKGTKFSLECNGIGIWYNGTDLWTYQPNTGETTVMKPTEEELLEANLMLYLNTSGNYTVASGKNKNAGTEEIILTPKKKNTGIKSVSVKASTKNWMPVKITVVPSSGSQVTINLKNVVVNSKIADSEFQYPKSKYPKAKIIDLR